MFPPGQIESAESQFLQGPGEFSSKLARKVPAGHLRQIVPFSNISPVVQFLIFIFSCNVAGDKRSNFKLLYVFTPAEARVSSKSKPGSAVIEMPVV